MADLFSILLILALAGVAIFFAPQIASAITTYSNAPKEKAKADEKQKQREDEGIFVTVGRVILGDKTLDDAIAKENQEKEKKIVEENTSKYLTAVYGPDSEAAKHINPKYKGKIILTDSERALIGIPLDKEPTQDDLIRLQNLRQKQKQKGWFEW